MADSPPAAARAEQQRARRPERDDGDHGVLRAAAPGGVTMPGDAIPAVPVQAQPGGAERLAKLRAVMLAEPFPGVLQDGVGKRLPLGIEAEQPGHLDHPVVHVPLLRPPGHRPGPASPLRSSSDPCRTEFMRRVYRSSNTYSRSSASSPRKSAGEPGTRGPTW